jgi:hypothetical protein
MALGHTQNLTFSDLVMSTMPLSHDLEVSMTLLGDDSAVPMAAESCLSGVNDTVESWR